MLIPKASLKCPLATYFIGFTQKTILVGFVEELGFGLIEKRSTGMYM